MTSKEFVALSDTLTASSIGIMNAKRGEYTGDSEDVLANFKEVADEVGITPLQVWGVYFFKHIKSIMSYVRQPDRVLSEPIEGRFSDAINYLHLGHGLNNEPIEQE